MNKIYETMFIPSVQTGRIQWIAILGSLVLLGFILGLVRKHKMGVEYSLLWFGCGALFLGISVERGSLEYFARFIGIAYPPAALFLLLLMGLYAMALHFSLVISRLSKTCTVLAQDLALMASENEELRGTKDLPRAPERGATEG
jgi:hypothetical protein